MCLSERLEVFKEHCSDWYYCNLLIKRQLKQEKLQNVMVHLINNRKDKCR